jgi:hypothetical protein
MGDVNEILSMEIMPSPKELLELNQQEGGSGYTIPSGSDHDEKGKDAKKSEGAESKKSKWCPVKGERRSTRISNDGRTSMEKAKDNKKKGL